MNQISDDYENVDQIIFPNVAGDCAKLGFTIERSDIVDALAGPIAAGLAKAYDLSSAEPFKEIQGMPPIEAVDECYFYITPEGMKRQLSDIAWWPFDDEGNPKNCAG